MAKENIMMKACQGHRTNPFPVWLMRQAGRYMKSYQKVREKYSFIEICKTPELAAEVTMQPVDQLGVDAAIIFADILLVPEAMGMLLNFKMDGSSPLFPSPVTNEADINKLCIPDPSVTNKYLIDAIKLVRSRLSPEIPLIGFSGSPWTLAVYMVEGQPDKELQRTKGLMYLEPDLFKTLLKKITESVKLYLNAQINAGVQIIQIFDSLAIHLSTNEFLTFSLPFMQEIVHYIKSQWGNSVPIIIFPRGASHSLTAIQQTGCDVISIDWTMSLEQAAALTHNSIVLQGNLDPMVMLSTTDIIAQQTHQILQEASSLNGFIFNLGHGILPNTPEDNVKFLIDFVHSKSTTE